MPNNFMTEVGRWGKYGAVPALGVLAIACGTSSPVTTGMTLPDRPLGSKTLLPVDPARTPETGGLSMATLGSIDFSDPTSIASMHDSTMINLARKNQELAKESGLSTSLYGVIDINIGGSTPVHEQFVMTGLADTQYEGVSLGLIGKADAPFSGAVFGTTSRITIDGKDRYSLDVLTMTNEGTQALINKKPVDVHNPNLVEEEPSFSFILADGVTPEQLKAALAQAPAAKDKLDVYLRLIDSVAFKSDTPNQPITMSFDQLISLAQKTNELNVETAGVEGQDRSILSIIDIFLNGVPAEINVAASTAVATEVAAEPSATPSAQPKTPTDVAPTQEPSKTPTETAVAKDTATAKPTDKPTAEATNSETQYAVEHQYSGEYNGVKVNYELAMTSEFMHASGRSFTDLTLNPNNPDAANKFAEAIVRQAAQAYLIHGTDKGNIQTIDQVVEKLANTTDSLTMELGVKTNSTVLANKEVVDLRKMLKNFNIIFTQNTGYMKNTNFDMYALKLEGDGGLTIEVSPTIAHLNKNDGLIPKYMMTADELKAIGLNISVQEGIDYNLSLGANRLIFTGLLFLSAPLDVQNPPNHTLPTDQLFSTADEDASVALGTPYSPSHNASDPNYMFRDVLRLVDNNGQVDKKQISNWYFTHINIRLTDNTP